MTTQILEPVTGEMLDCYIVQAAKAAGYEKVLGCRVVTSLNLSGGPATAARVPTSR